MIQLLLFPAFVSPAPERTGVVSPKVGVVWPLRGRVGQGSSLAVAWPPSFRTKHSVNNSALRTNHPLNGQQGHTPHCLICLSFRLDAVSCHLNFTSRWLSPGAGSFSDLRFRHELPGFLTSNFKDPALKGVQAHSKLTQCVRLK